MSVRHVGQDELKRLDFKLPEELLIEVLYTFSSSLTVGLRDIIFNTFFFSVYPFLDTEYGCS